MNSSEARLWIVWAVILCFYTSQAQAQEQILLIDAHIHYSHDAWDKTPPKKAIRILRQSGLRRVLVSSSSDDGTQMLYKEAPDLVVPVLRPYYRRGELSTWMHDSARMSMIRKRLETYKYAGIGEFHAFGRELRTDLLRGMIAAARKYDLFLHAHTDIAGLHEIFRQYKKARVLWAHAGFEDPAEVEKMLKKYPRLWADLAYRFDHAKDGKVTPRWRSVFESFPKRFVTGTDTYTPERWQEVAAHSRWTRAWLADLPPHIAQRIGWKNAQTLIGDFN